MSSYKFSIKHRGSKLDLKLESGSVYVWSVGFGHADWKPYYETDLNPVHLISCLVEEILKLKQGSKVKEILDEIESLARRTGAV